MKAASQVSLDTVKLFSPVGILVIVQRHMRFCHLRLWGSSMWRIPGLIQCYSQATCPVSDSGMMYYCSCRSPEVFAATDKAVSHVTDSSVHRAAVNCGRQQHSNECNSTTNCFCYTLLWHLKMAKMWWTWRLQVNGPSVYRSYLAAARRVGLSDAAAGYWELHIKEDERHGRQMVEDVAVPLIEQ